MADPTVYQSNYTQAQIDSVPGLSLWISQKERWNKVGTSVPNPGGRGAGSHVIDYANSGISDQINNAVANPADFVKTALTQNLVQSSFQSQFGFNYGENPRNSLSYITIDPDIIKSQVSYLQKNAPNLLPQIQTDANASFQREANYASSTGDSGIFGGIAAFFDNNLLSAVMIIVAIVAPEVIPALGALVTGDTAAAAAIMEAGASAAAAGTSVASAVAAAVPVETSVAALTAIGQASVAAASTAIAGGDLGQIAESAALAGGSSVAGGEISKAVTPTVGNVAGAGITGAATGAGVAAITGQDIGSAALTGALKGAVSSEVKGLTSSPTTATISGGSNVIPVEGMPGSYINPLGQPTDSAGNILSAFDSGVNATAPVYPTTAEADAARATAPASKDPEAATSLPYQGLDLASNAKVTGVDTSTGQTVVQITQPSPGQADTNIVYYATYEAGDPGNASDSKPVTYTVSSEEPGNPSKTDIVLKEAPIFDKSGNVSNAPTTATESVVKTSTEDPLTKYVRDTYGIGAGTSTSTSTPVVPVETTPAPVATETAPVVTQEPTDTTGGTYGSIPTPDSTTNIAPDIGPIPSEYSPTKFVNSSGIPVNEDGSIYVASPVVTSPVVETTPVTETTPASVVDTTPALVVSVGTSPVVTQGPADTTDTAGGTYGTTPAPDTTTVISPPDIEAIESAFSPSGFVNSSGTPVNKDGSIYVAAAPVTDTPVASVDTVAPLAPIEPEGGTYTAEPTPSSGGGTYTGSGGGGTYTVTPSEGVYTGDKTPESTKIDPTTPLIKTPKEEDSTSTTTITPGSPGVGFNIPTIPGSVKSSPGSSALLAALGASLAPDKELGDVESTTGGKKKLVWNEASLRNLQDALGI